MKKKKAYLIIVIVILLAILLGFIYMYVQRKNTVAQIKKVVLNCTQNKVDARFIVPERRFIAQYKIIGAKQVE